MKPLAWILLSLVAVVLSSPDAPAQTAPLEESVVKLHVTQRRPNPWAPWAPGQAAESGGTGVVIEGNRILTCAHVAAYASQIMVESTQHSARIPARVEFIARDIDLAILTVDDPGFFESHPAVPLGEQLPTLRDSVTVYGFPMGGDAISITQGVVSRIEFESFYYNLQGFRVQIDAAVNPGNSGGPAVADGRIIGIVFSGIPEGENIGYLIAAEEIRLFLADIADGTYDGKARLPVDWSTTEYQALRGWLRMTPDITGAMVIHGHPLDSEFPVKAGDIIVSVGPYNVDDQAMVRLEGLNPVGLEAAIQRIQRDGSVPLSLWRDGAQVEVVAPLESDPYQLIPRDDGQKSIPFIVYGPLAFSPATPALQAAMNGNENVRRWLEHMQSPLITRGRGKQRFAGEQMVVMVCPPLQHASSLRMPRQLGQVVARVNGEEIRNFAQFIRVLKQIDTEFAVFEFLGTGITTMVVRATDIDATTDDILRENGIRDRMSPDAQAIWDEDR